MQNYRLLSEEASYRRERSLAYRLREAQLPWRWTLASFPFERQPGVNKAQIQTLAGLDFLRPARRHQRGQNHAQKSDAEMYREGRAHMQGGHVSLTLASLKFS